MSETDKTAEQSAEELRSEIEETREQLGETVEQLAAKTDVKARAHEKVEHVQAEVKSKPAIPVAAVVAGVAVVALLVLRRRRS